MKTTLTQCAVVAICGLMIAGCQQGPGGYGNRTSQMGDKETVGTLLGAAGGAVAGANIGKGTGRYVAIAAGTLLGAALGNSVGSSLDKADMQYYNSTSQHALEQTKTGTTTTWKNPDSGHYGTVTPLSTFQNPQGQYCREYSQTIVVGGQTQEGYGVACRQPDGAWKIQS